jgi:hypothetical protein
MNAQSKKKRNVVGMSPQDIKTHLGLVVSDRQFRRYIKEGLIPDSWIKKTAHGHFHFEVPLNTKWGDYRRRIEQWRRLRFQRGWNKRPRRDDSMNPLDKSRGIVTIEGLSQKFDMWARKMFPEIVGWDDANLTRLHSLLFNAGCLFLWAEKNCENSAALTLKRDAMIRLLDEQGAKTTQRR